MASGSHGCESQNVILSTDSNHGLRNIGFAPVASHERYSTRLKWFAAADYYDIVCLRRFLAVISKNVTAPRLGYHYLFIFHPPSVWTYVAVADYWGTASRVSNHDSKDIPLTGERLAPLSICLYILLKESYRSLRPFPDNTYRLSFPSIEPRLAPSKPQECLIRIESSFA